MLFVHQLIYRWDVCLNVCIYWSVDLKIVDGGQQGHNWETIRPTYTILVKWLERRGWFLQPVVSLVNVPVMGPGIFRQWDARLPLQMWCSPSSVIRAPPSVKWMSRVDYRSNKAHTQGYYRQLRQPKHWRICRASSLLQIVYRRQAPEVR